MVLHDARKRKMSPRLVHALRAWRGAGAPRASIVSLLVGYIHPGPSTTAPRKLSPSFDLVRGMHCVSLQTRLSLRRPHTCGTTILVVCSGGAYPGVCASGGRHITVALALVITAFVFCAYIRACIGVP